MIFGISSLMERKKEELENMMRMSTECLIDEFLNQEKLNELIFQN
jgi:hypothetical protein